MIQTKMIISIAKILPVAGLILLITSCVSREKIVYFQGDENEVDSVITQYSPKIQPDDLLVITVSARDEITSTPFNQVNSFSQSQRDERLQTYLVDAEGNIEFPVLGKLKLGGLTRIEAISYIKGKLSEYILDPGVEIKITNFKVTVLGEVNKPGTFNLSNERITVLEALGLAGDLTINGVRQNVMVVREKEGKRETFRLDLTSNEMFNSPAYFLTQNDVVYVEPNKPMINSSNYSRNTSIIIAVAGLAISVISLLIRIF